MSIPEEVRERRRELREAAIKLRPILPNLSSKFKGCRFSVAAGGRSQRPPHVYVEVAPFVKIEEIAPLLPAEVEGYGVRVYQLTKEEWDEMTPWY